MNRRRFLQGLGLAPAAAFAALPVVSSIEVFRVPVNRRGDWILVRLKTLNGLTGIGDASHARPDSATIELLRQFFAGLKGRSIFEVEWLRRSTLSEIAKHGQPAAVALSGLEQCLWDLQGQALGVPTYAPFGGALRNQIRNYANINRSTEERSPEGFARMAGKAVQAGFDAIKLAPFDDMPKIGSDPTIMEQFTKLGIERAARAKRDRSQGRSPDRRPQSLRSSERVGASRTNGIPEPVLARGGHSAPPAGPSGCDQPDRKDADCGRRVDLRS